MPDIKNEQSVIELLREKTEEVDLKQFLKPSLGGYTKKSVLNYLTVLKKQQQVTAETFYQNLQALFAVKESLKANDQILHDRLTKAEIEYKNLSESMLICDLESKSSSAQDVVHLKAVIAAQESELNRIKGVNCDLGKKIDSLNESIQGLTTALEQSNQETQTQKNLLIAEKNVSKKLRLNMIELTNLAQEGRDEIKYLKGAMSEANIAELQANIASLMAQVSTQAELIANCNAENALKEQTVEALTAESESEKQNIAHLIKTLENLNMQNDKLLNANSALKSALEEVYKKQIVLITEKSDTVIEKLTANKKLDESNTKLSILEFQMEQFKNQKRSLS